jgi:DNA-binding FrmR family transcriptional regulator
MYGYALNKDELEARLAKIEGQVRGIRRMVDQDKYCIDILTQLNAVSAALKAVGVGLLDTHVRHCVRDSIRQGEGDAQIEELVATVARFVGR